jgi:hypothetical protein
VCHERTVDRVLPFYDEHGIPLSRVLTDRGTEYCGSPEHHEYELYLAVEDIDHTRTKTKSPQTNGICERFHKTVLDEFYRVAFRKKLYRSLDELQADLDAWLKEYNEVRTRDAGASARRQCRRSLTPYPWRRRKCCRRLDRRPYRPIGHAHRQIKCILLQVRAPRYLLHALEAQLDPFRDPTIGNIAASGRQGWLPRIDTNHPQRWPGSRRLDRNSPDARADIKERRGPTLRCRELWPLF